MSDSRLTGQAGGKTATAESIADAGSNTRMAYLKARFRKPVMPGAGLKVHVTRIHNRGPVWKFAGEAKVDGVRVAEADFSAMIVDQTG